MKKNHTALVCATTSAVLLLATLGGCAATSPEAVDLTWPSPPDTARVAYVRSVRGSQEFPKGFFNTVYETLIGSDAGSLNLAKPFSVASDPAGNIYVSDTQLGRVVVFDYSMRKIRFIGDSEPARVVSPMGLAVHDSVVFVADNLLKKVFSYSVSGRVLMTYDAGFSNPVACSYDGSTRQLFVADAKLHQIIVLDDHGRELKRFGSDGEDEHRLYVPTGVVVSGDTLYVVDSMHFRVVLYTLDGKFISSFGSVGTAPGTFSRPKGIARTPDGKLVVTDAAFGNVQLFDGAGQVYMFFGSNGTGPGQFQLASGIWADARGFIYVVDQLNGRVQVFRYLEGGTHQQ